MKTNQMLIMATIHRKFNKLIDLVLLKKSLLAIFAVPIIPQLIRSLKHDSILLYLHFSKFMLVLENLLLNHHAVAHQRSLMI
jgi:hypothetical protein